MLLTEDNLAKEIWTGFPGNWEVAVMPQNKKGLNFWLKCIKEFTKNQFSETRREVAHDPGNYQIIFSFRSSPATGFER